MFVQIPGSTYSDSSFDASETSALFEVGFVW